MLYSFPASIRSNRFSSGRHDTTTLSNVSVYLFYDTRVPAASNTDTSEFDIRCRSLQKIRVTHHCVVFCRQQYVLAWCWFIVYRWCIANLVFIRSLDSTLPFLCRFSMSQSTLHTVTSACVPMLTVKFGRWCWELWGCISTKLRTVWYDPYLHSLQNLNRAVFRWLRCSAVWGGSICRSWFDLIRWQI